MNLFSYFTQVYDITDSQKFSLMAGATDSLVGRAGIFELYSLSASEMEKHYKLKADKKTILQWIFTGGYPEIHRLYFFNV
jgi:hypothetical protein